MKLKEITEILKNYNKLEASEKPSVIQESDIDLLEKTKNNCIWNSAYTLATLSALKLLMKYTLKDKMALHPLETEKAMSFRFKMFNTVFLNNLLFLGTGLSIIYSLGKYEYLRYTFYVKYEKVVSSFVSRQLEMESLKAKTQESSS